MTSTDKRAKAARKSRDHQKICELETSKLFNRHYGENPEETNANKMEIRRTPNSGGWDKQKAPGDIMVPAWFPITVECKFSESITLDQLCFSNSALFEKWWKQSVNDAQESKRYPVLVVRPIRRPKFIALRLEDWNFALKIEPSRYKLIEDFTWFLFIPNSHYHNGLVLLLLDDFVTMFPGRADLVESFPTLTNFRSRDERTTHGSL